MFHWGSNSMKVKKGSYQASFPTLEISELKVIPSATGVGLSIIQTGGADRKKPSMRIKVQSIEEYNTYTADYLQSIQRIFEDIQGNSINAIISSVGPLTRIGSNWFEFDIQFIEV